MVTVVFIDDMALLLSIQVDSTCRAPREPMRGMHATMRFDAFAAISGCL